MGVKASEAMTGGASPEDPRGPAEPLLEGEGVTNPGFALAPCLYYFQIWGQEQGGDQIAAGWAEACHLHTYLPTSPSQASSKNH